MLAPAHANDVGWLRGHNGIRMQQDEDPIENTQLTSGTPLHAGLSTPAPPWPLKPPRPLTQECPRPAWHQVSMESPATQEHMPTLAVPATCLRMARTTARRAGTPTDTDNIHLSTPEKHNTHARSPPADTPWTYQCVSATSMQTSRPRPTPRRDYPRCHLIQANTNTNRTATHFHAPTATVVEAHQPHANKAFHAPR